MIQYIDPETRYSAATIHHGMVYLAGQVPEDGTADIGAQTKSVLQQIDALLARCGSDKAHILEATIYLTDMQADYAGMNAVWDAWVAPGRAPARACVQAALARADWKVEIKLTAVQKQG